MKDWEMFKYYIDFAKSYYDNMETWTDRDKLQETVFSIEREIKRLRDEGVIN